MKLSVIVPIYMMEKYIAKTIKSLINQTYKEFELILVNDGSTDNSVQIATETLKSTDITYKVIDQENSGLGIARNTGLAQAKGDWVLFLDSDDIITSNTLKALLEVGEKNNSQVVFSGYKNILKYEQVKDNPSAVKTKSYSVNKIQKDFLKRKLIILAPGTLYKREFLIENNLFFGNLRWSEDQHFIWRVLSKAERIDYLEGVYYYYLHHENSIMTGTQHNKMVDSYQEILKLPCYFSGNKKISKNIVPRWVMGTINSASSICNYKQWKDLCRQLSVKKHFRKLLCFLDLKVQLCATLWLICPKLYYMLLKKD